MAVLRRAFLLKSLEQGRLTLPPDTTVTAQKNLLNRLGRATWNVKILDRYAHGRGIVRLPVDEFLARLLEHVPPTDMQTVRPYGLYANSKRPELAQAREHFGQTPRPAKGRLSWYDFCERHGIPPSRAPPESANAARPAARKTPPTAHLCC